MNISLDLVFFAARITVLAVLLAFAVMKDLAFGKIPNRLTLMGLVSGFAVNVVQGTVLPTHGLGLAFPGGLAGMHSGGYSGMLPGTLTGVFPGILPAILTGTPPGALAATQHWTLNWALPGVVLFVMLFVLISALIPFVSLVALYKLKMFGAGDIKLLMAVGAIVGAIPVVEIMLYSFLAGGAISLVVVVSNGCVRKCAKRLLEYLKGCFLQMRFLPYHEAQTQNCNAGYSDLGGSGNSYGCGSSGSGSEIGITRFSRVVQNGGMLRFSLAVAAGAVIYIITAWWL